jgi:hypothetical protein
MSGKGNTGTLTNGPTYSRENGGSFVFDGSDDYVEGRIQPSVFSGPHTICCWFWHTSNANWSGLFSNNVGTHGSSILTFIEESNKVGVNQAGARPESIAVDLGADHLNQWLYAVVSYAGVTTGSTVGVYAYKKGALLSTSGPLYWNLTSSASYMVGRHYSGGHVHKGRIAHVAVYNRVLTAAEIEQNYNALCGRFGLPPTANAGATASVPMNPSSTTAPSAADRLEAEKVRPFVSFTTANNGASVVTTSGGYVTSWSQSGLSTAPTVSMVPAIGYGHNHGPSGPTSASSNVTLVPNVFGNHPGILSSVPGCLATSEPILFGGGADSSLTFTMYLLCRPVSKDEHATYLGGGYRVDGSTLNGRQTCFVRQASTGTIVNNTQNATELWKPMGTKDIQGPFSYPSASGFEVWCFCKFPSAVGTEVYRNNHVLAFPADTNTQRSTPGPSPYEPSAFWRLGAGACYYGGGGRSYIGAFLVYRTYHDSAMRSVVQKSLEQQFGMSAS